MDSLAYTQDAAEVAHNVQLHALASSSGRSIEEYLDQEEPAECRSRRDHLIRFMPEILRFLERGEFTDGSVEIRRILREFLEEEVTISPYGEFIMAKKENQEVTLIVRMIAALPADHPDETLETLTLDLDVASIHVHDIDGPVAGAKVLSYATCEVFPEGPQVRFVHGYPPLTGDE